MPIKSVIQLESRWVHGDRSLLPGVLPQTEIKSYYILWIRECYKNWKFLTSKARWVPPSQVVNEWFLRNFQIISIGFGESIHYYEDVNWPKSLNKFVYTTFAETVSFSWVTGKIQGLAIVQMVDEHNNIQHCFKEASTVELERV